VPNRWCCSSATAHVRRKTEIAALARKLHAPIVHTYRALDLYPFDDAYVIGGLGLIGSKAAYDAIHACELLLMIGSDYPYKEFLPQKAQVVQIDERAFILGRRLPVAQSIVGSARPSVAALLARVKSRTDDSFLSTYQRDWTSWTSIAGQESRSGPQQAAHSPASPGAQRQRSGGRGCAILR